MDSSSALCMANDGKYTKHTRHITRRVNFVINGENFKMHKIEWCEVGLKLAYIATNNFGDNDLNHKIKYTMVRLENCYKTLVKEGWQDIG